MPTNKPVPSQDPSDLLFNAGKLDEAVNGSAETFTDRLGFQRLTLAGAVARIAAIDVRGAWAPGTAYDVLDVVSSGGTWYICVVPHISSAAFATDEATKWRVYQGVTTGDLATSGGAAMVGFGTGTVDDALREVFSVRKFMTAAEWADANNPAGPTNNMHSAAFAACFAAAAAAGVKRVWVPPVLGAYSVRDVDIPAGIKLLGVRQPLYNPLAVTDVYGKGSVILRATGGINLFRWRSGCTAEGITFYSVSRGADCFQTVSGRMSQLNIVDCGIYNFSRGIGNPQYIGTARVFRCNIAGNNVGVYGLVDSQIYGNFINANTSQGVDQPDGANDTFFVGNKVEWNGAENYRFFNSLNCSIDGDIIDRAGRAGIRVSGTSRVTINPAVMRRNGASILGDPECAHVYLEFGSTSKIILGPFLTGSGANDDGTGATTPNYGVSIGGATGNGELTMVGGSLTGAVTEAIRYGATPGIIKVMGVQGTDDRVNSGVSRVRDGRHYIANPSSIALAPGATLTGAVADASMPTFSVPKQRRLLVEVRNPSDGSKRIAEALCVIHREGGSATVHVLAVTLQYVISAAGVVTTSTTFLGTSASETLQISFANVAADASSFDLNVKNNSGSTTFAVAVYWMAQ